MNKAFDRLWLIQHGCAYQTGLELIPAVIEGAGLAASVGGTVAQMQGANQSRNAMSDALQAELMRQQGYQTQARDVFNKSLQASTPPVRDQQISAGQQAAAQNYAKLASLPLGGDVVSAMPISDKTIAQNVSDYTSQRAQSGAQLQGLGQYSVDQYVKDVLANAQMAPIQFNSRFSQSVLPLELQAAQNKGANLAGMGKLLSILGSAASSYGAAAGSGSAGMPVATTGGVPASPYTQQIANTALVKPTNVYPGVDPYNLNNLYGGYY